MKKHWIVNREPLAGSSTSNIIRLLIQNRFRVHPKYWLRLLYAFTLSLICFPLRLVERLRFNRKIKRYELPQDPIFIIGHWRSGTTFMHYLFAQDDSKGLVSNVEVYAPHFFLAFPRISRKLIEVSLPETRPMDKIKINADLPGEEEHSLGAYDKYGFFHSMIFPRNFEQYAKYKSFDNASPKDLQRWKRRYQFFIKKVALKKSNRDKRLVLKNPANTYRVKHLIEMYPNAKFIHLYRNPYEVYASTIKFHNDTCEVFALQTWDMDELKENVLDLYQQLYVNFDEKIEIVSEDNWVDVRYEDFIENPLRILKRVYSSLNLEGFEKSKSAFKAFLEDQKDYQPASYDFSKELISRVNEACGFIFEKYDYEQL
ncbi:MAG: sulfotransferase [Asgard group archaeon]|nr:sulfotransferase [Asgard group archaeon]